MIKIGDTIHVVGPREEEYTATVVAVRGTVVDAETPRGIYLSLGYMPWPEPFTWHYPGERHLPMETLAKLIC